MPLIKSFGQEKKTEEQVEHYNTDYYKVSWQMTKMSQLFTGCTAVIDVIQTLVVVLYGTSLVTRGIITLDIWIAFYLFARQLKSSVSSIMSIWVSLKKSKGTVYRLSMIMDEKEEEDTDSIKEIDRHQTFHVDQVCFSYGDKPVLQNISFCAKPGQKIALVGKSRSGKTTFFNLVERFYEPTAGKIPTLLMQPITCYRSIKQGQGMSAKISSLVEEPEEKLKCKRSFALENSDIILDHVNFSYGRKANLTDVSMTLPYGKMTAIVGPSGAGKSTLLNILERFYIPNGGEIRFGNVPVEDIHLDEWRDAWGYVQQNSAMIRGTIRDNICFGTKRNVTDTEIRAVCEEANILNLVDSLPKGLDTDIGEIGNKLSGGERQRVAIARMLIRNPDFVILDEATNNLDAENAREVQKTLEKVIRGRTSVVVTHDMQSIRHADQIVVLCKGRVTAIGTHEELYGNDKTYTEFCQLQQKMDS